MVAELPHIAADGRYSQKQAAQLLGVHRNTLAAASAAGHIKFGIRRSNMRKFYLGSEIVRFWRSQL
jgi:predicted site-specific integrase-resolvase